MQAFNILIPDSVVSEIEYYVTRIAEESITDAVKWYQDIRRAINTLNQTPTRCPQADETVFHDFEIRHLVMGNYRILFRIEDSVVQVLHIKHTKMERTPISHN